METGFTSTPPSIATLKMSACHPFRAAKTASNLSHAYIYWPHRGLASAPAAKRACALAT